MAIVDHVGQTMNISDNSFKDCANKICDILINVNFYQSIFRKS